MSKLGVLLWRHIFETGDAKRLAKQVQDLSDLHIVRDLSYLNDGGQGHLFDIYELPDLSADASVLINIHGGGLFASYKEVNVNFNYEWARLGYRVVSLSYRRIPETTLWHQIDDCMAALRYLKAHAAEYHLNLDRCVLTGDSAGALLSLFALSINGSKKLQETFGIEGAGIPFRAAGFVSIMLDTQRRDLMCAINNVVTDKSDRGRPHEKYLLDPARLLGDAILPPLFLVSSAEDLIGKDTLKFDRLLTEKGFAHTLLSFPKGRERKLVHVFSVMYPMYPESREVFTKMDAFFKEVL
ncbi:MAG: alpha/beta hydrolase [Oscillospiraceae bacterium]|nr:alpha/beta hydrolase [Oscillospiraceae bacterium]